MREVREVREVREASGESGMSEMSEMREMSEVSEVRWVRVATCCVSSAMRHAWLNWSECKCDARHACTRPAPCSTWEQCSATSVWQTVTVGEACQSSACI